MNPEFLRKHKRRYRTFANGPPPSDGRPAGIAPLVFSPIERSFRCEACHSRMSQNWGSLHSELAQFGGLIWPTWDVVGLGRLCLGLSVEIRPAAVAVGMWESAAVADFHGPSFPQLFAFTFRRFLPPDSASPPSAGIGMIPCRSPECEPDP